MMRALFSLACALSLAVPAAAAPVAGKTPEDLAVQVMHFYAACVIEHTPQGAKDLLALDSHSSEYRTKMMRLAQGHPMCVGDNRLKFNGVLLQGALAERLLQLYDAPPRFASSVAFNASARPIEAQDEMEVMAACIVRADPDKVWMLFASDPTSDAEGTALQALSPTLMSCVRAGQKVAINRPGLRAVLAVSAYRLSHQDTNPIEAHP
jgi:hypothetical protein